MTDAGDTMKEKVIAEKTIGARCAEFIDRHPLMPWPERMIAFALSEVDAALEEAAKVAESDTWCETNNCAGRTSIAAAIRKLKGGYGVIEPKERPA